MSDSTVDTNIPVMRIPFGASIPPKVPYADANDVGTDTKPLKLVGKKLTPVSGELAPKQAPTFTRTSTGGTTENDVPTSPTPGSADPASMVATKGYVDSARAKTYGNLLNGTWAVKTVTNIGETTKPSTTKLSLKSLKSGFMSIDFKFDSPSPSTSAVTLTVDVNGTVVAKSHGYPTNSAGVTMLLPVKTNDVVSVVCSVANLNPTHVYVNVIY